MIQKIFFVLLIILCHFEQINGMHRLTRIRKLFPRHLPKNIFLKRHFSQLNKVKSQLNRDKITLKPYLHIFDPEYIQGLPEEVSKKCFAEFETMYSIYKLSKTTNPEIAAQLKKELEESNLKSAYCEMFNKEFDPEKDVDEILKELILEIELSKIRGANKGRLLNLTAICGIFCSIILLTDIFEKKES